MQVQMGTNGWPGIFIPGDEAVLGLAQMLDWVADAIDTGKPVDPNFAIGLRNKAEQLRACWVEKA